MPSIAKARMAALAKMGLAQPDGSGWRLRLDFLQVLKTMQQAGDRQKMLNQYGILLSDPRLPTQVKRLKDIAHLEGRIIAHIHDDATGAPHMILEGTDARVHFIRHDAAMEEMRSKGLLKPNSFVAIWRAEERKSDPLLSIEDLGDADLYLGSTQIRNSARRLIQRGWMVHAEYGGWLGKYYKKVSELRDPAQSHPVTRTARISPAPGQPRGR